jgi:hypothetical protein
MMREAARQGVLDAARRFAVREASTLETLLGILGAGVGGSVARGALNAVSPRALPALESLGAMPINAVRRAVNPMRTPADAIVRHLDKAQLPPMPSGMPRML